MATPRVTPKYLLEKLDELGYTIKDKKGLSHKRKECGPYELALLLLGLPINPNGLGKAKSKTTHKNLQALEDGYYGRPSQSKRGYQPTHDADRYDDYYMRGMALATLYKKRKPSMEGLHYYGTEGMYEFIKRHQPRYYYRYEVI
jgi:hypothetical protein